MNVNTGVNDTLYERLGGKEAIGQVVESFYDKVLADPVVNHFFKGTDMKKQIRHQTLFMSWITGGPNAYTGKSMQKAHAGLNLQEKHFQAIAYHLVTTLQQFEVPRKDIDQIVEKLLSMKDDILEQ
jgi:hemoglobin